MIGGMTGYDCLLKAAVIKRKDPWADNRHEVYILHPPFPLNHESTVFNFI
jgi:hypothetical protein